jgi:hypothetical protein
MWAGVCRENSRVVLKADSRRGPTYIIDGVPLTDSTPAGIANALNSQHPKVLSVLDALSEAAKHEKK